MSLSDITSLIFNHILTSHNEMTNKTNTDFMFPFFLHVLLFLFQFLNSRLIHEQEKRNEMRGKIKRGVRNHLHKMICKQKI